MTERPPNREPLDALLNQLLPFAQQCLAKYGEFHPFGAALKQDGEMGLIAADPGEEDRESQVVIDMMLDGMKQNRDQYLAVGICCDVLGMLPGETKKTDMIQVSLEHRDGTALDVLMPYRKRRFLGVRYEELVAVQGTPAVFI